MTSQFLDFYNSLDADPTKRGRQFEHFVKWFLKADPEWLTQVDQVWLWHEYPDRWGTDCGVDLVFRHKNGEHWAVQAKCYSPDYDITKHDVDKFLSESNRPSIKHRLLIATTDRIGANAKQVCAAQDKPVIRFLLSDFDKSALDYPADFASLPQAKRKARPEARDHQVDARTAVVQGLQTADRGQLIMACGTGKTYVTLWIKEALNAQRTLVLVPSLGLLDQFATERAYFKQNFAISHRIWKKFDEGRALFPDDPAVRQSVLAQNLRAFTATQLATAWSRVEIWDCNRYTTDQRTTIEASCGITVSAATFLTRDHLEVETRDDQLNQMIQAVHNRARFRLASYL